MLDFKLGYTYTINWLAENHLLYNKIYQWDLETMMDHICEVNEQITMSTLPTIHTIWDATAIDVYPTNLNDIRDAFQPLFHNKKLGWFITVINNPVFGYLSQAGTCVFNGQYRSFKTMPTAFEFLQGKEPSLPRLI